MRITIVKCDRCGAEIEGDPIKIFMTPISRVFDCGQAEAVTVQLKSPDSPKRRMARVDLCLACADRMMDVVTAPAFEPSVRAAVDESVKEVDKSGELDPAAEESESEADTEKPAEETLDLSEMADITEPETADEELALMPVPKKEVHNKLPIDNNLLRRLANQGMSTERIREVIKKEQGIDCTTTTIRNRLRAMGL